MSTLVSKYLLINCKNLVKIKPINLKTTFLIDLKRTLRSIPKKSSFSSPSSFSSSSFYKFSRSYVRLYNRENQTNNFNKANETVESATTNKTLTAATEQASKNATQTIISNAEAEVPAGIFKRFKAAYKQHGKVLLACHVVLCGFWFTGFYFLADSGFDINKLFNILESLHIFSHETSISIANKIETFNLEQFLRNYHFDYIFSDSTLEWFGKLITGVHLKHIIVAIMLYKIFTPLRYLATLAATKISINMLKKGGYIPMKPPPGSSITEIVKEQKHNLRRSVLAQQERLARARSRFKSLQSHKKPPTPQL